MAAPQNLMPGVLTPRGMESYGQQDNSRFVATETNGSQWIWTSPVFSLRPGLDHALNQAVNALPINHEAAIGLNHYLNVMICSAGGMHPPAALEGLTAFYTEYGNTVDSGRMFAITKEFDISDLMLAGGVTAVAPSRAGANSGASVLSFTPAHPMIRFWQVSIRILLPEAVPGLDLIALPMMH